MLFELERIDGVRGTFDVVLFVGEPKGCQFSESDGRFSHDSSCF